MSYNIIHCITLGVMWAVILRGMRDSWLARRRRRNQELWEHSLGEIAQETGLARIQVQLAMDDANACFNQRIFELVRSGGGAQ